LTPTYNHRKWKTPNQQTEGAPWVFEARKFLEDNFGTADAVIGLAAQYGLEIPVRDTVRKWFARGSIAGEWLPVLLVLLELEKGKLTSLKGYVQDGGCNDIFA
jgi:hypothetical protein